MQMALKLLHRRARRAFRMFTVLAYSHVAMKIGLTVLGLISLAFVNSGCGKPHEKPQGSYELDSHSFTADKLRMIEQKAGILMPTDARGLNFFFQETNIDQSFIAKIEIPALSSNEVSNQLAQIGKDDGGVANLFRTKLAWWDISGKTVRVRRVFIDTRSGWGGEVFLCEKGGRWVLYIDCGAP